MYTVSNYFPNIAPMINRLLRFSLFILLVTSTLKVSAQGVATPLGPQINTEYEELAPKLSPDDQRMYFVRGQYPQNIGGRVAQDIWVSKRLADGSWSTAKNIGAPLNNKLHNSVGAIGQDGKELLLTNVYSKLKGAETPGISRSVFKNGKWSFPEEIISSETIGNKANSISFCADLELSNLVFTIVDEYGAADLFVSFRTAAGAWTTPITLGPEINTPRFETSPFLSRDGKTLFFASNGHGGEGDADIFMSQRLDETWQKWSKPVNLGPNVNTAGFDAHFILNSSGETAYFVSGPSPDALSDIYSIATANIPALNAPENMPDTLHVLAKGHSPTPISMDAFGISDKQGAFASAKSLNGQGKILIRKSEPIFVYQPAADFFGIELLEVTMCDPPHSDACKTVIVQANVEPKAPPTYTILQARTPKNTPTKLDIANASIIDVTRSNKGRPKMAGRIAKNNETGGEHIFFRPGNDFVGIDSISLYLHCNKPRPADCILAKVIIEVYEDAIAIAEPDPVQPVQDSLPAANPAADVLISGKVTDEKSGNPLAATLTFYAQPSNQELGRVKSDPKTGAFALRLPAGVQYSILAKEKYHFDRSSLVAASAQDEVQRNFMLTPLPTEVGTVFRLDNIYFDTGKATLKPASKAELARLYKFLKANPTVRIQISGHTDALSDADHNLALSNSRAHAVANYLKYRGVMGTRLDAIGYGEEKAIATNDTEEGRALNRRVEFVITQK